MKFWTSFNIFRFWGDLFDMAVPLEYKKGGIEMSKRIVKRIFVVASTLSLFNGVLIGFHLMFYPNVGFLDSEGWKSMLFYFGYGLWSQYIALHFLNEQGDQEESEESN